MSESSESTHANLLQLFVGGQSIDNIRLNDGDVCFDVREQNFDIETERKIRQSDLEDIEGFFAHPLHCHPYAKHLLLVLWIREVKFEMGALNDEDMNDFIRSTFDLYCIDICHEIADDIFFSLYREGYLQDTILGGEWKGYYSLTPKGRYAAEEMFKTLKMLLSDTKFQTISEEANIVAVLEKLDKRLEKPILIESSPRKKPPLTQEDFPVEKEGFWESQKEYSIRKKLNENTLRRYREKIHGVRFSEDGTWGIDKADNIFKREGDKQNSPYRYFVRHDP